MQLAQQHSQGEQEEPRRRYQRNQHTDGDSVPHAAVGQHVEAIWVDNIHPPNGGRRQRLPMPPDAAVSDGAPKQHKHDDKKHDGVDEEQEVRLEIVGPHAVVDPEAMVLLQHSATTADVAMAYMGRLAAVAVHAATLSGSRWGRRVGREHGDHVRYVDGHRQEGHEENGAGARGAGHAVRHHPPDRHHCICEKRVGEPGQQPTRRISHASWRRVTQALGGGTPGLGGMGLHRGPCWGHYGST
mmetsp:Transcript_104222/g.222784  ORF Transcript_104222/g.222784 Transcript_104222/m.222784 type:complete len:242 (-) Transcript_104222:7-732(-)